MLYNACKGINKNCYGGISIPATVDNNGILNNWVETGILAGNINPFCIWHWGIVGERKTYLVPRQNSLDIGFL